MENENKTERQKKERPWMQRRRQEFEERCRTSDRQTERWTRHQFDWDLDLQGHSRRRGPLEECRYTVTVCWELCRRGRAQPQHQSNTFSLMTSMLSPELCRRIVSEAYPLRPKIQSGLYVGTNGDFYYLLYVFGPNSSRAKLIWRLFHHNFDVDVWTPGYKNYGASWWSKIHTNVMRFVKEEEASNPGNYDRAIARSVDRQGDQWRERRHYGESTRRNNTMGA
ncbi:hypothetical protein SEMRO_926_G221060.1 [Seminavis robusta]|uniref:Uncharacterized protein n=1 Tax=Seminavis robusta TaxID=568900 RepID=A0A9N8HPT5_9STRA|nr:hypothetical protein SEMRO_926_G221060.1 [Seminavis robusta]|eukprot:Sro926_g221060.1 n/a (223) ;mRNA; f:29129-29797